MEMDQSADFFGCILLHNMIGIQVKIVNMSWESKERIRKTPYANEKPSHFYRRN